MFIGTPYKFRHGQMLSIRSTLEAFPLDYHIHALQLHIDNFEAQHNLLYKSKTLPNAMVQYLL